MTSVRMPENFDFKSWHQSLEEKVYWRKISMDESYHLLKITDRAHSANSHYFMNDVTGGTIGLTTIYKQCKLLALLKKDYNV